MWIDKSREDITAWAGAIWSGDEMCTATWIQFCTTAQATSFARWEWSVFVYSCRFIATIWCTTSIITAVVGTLAKLVTTIATIIIIAPQWCKCKLTKSEEGQEYK